MGTRSRILGALAGLACIGAASAPHGFAAPAPTIGPPYGQVGIGRSEVVHVPPVDADITDPFRAPEHAFGPGNRGLEYDTFPGQAVTASAPGTVTFAGQVAGSLFVTVDHGNGLRTTVGLLAEVSIGVGANVAQGATLGIAADKTHFSARQDGQYIDPELLFGSVEIVVRLVARPG